MVEIFIMQLVRIHKFTPKLLLVYFLIVILIIFAKPQPDAYFFVGLFIILIGQIIRFWAAGYLVKNKFLTTAGPYAYLKNPLYLGTLLIMIGFCIIGEGDYYINWILLGIGIFGFFLYYVPYKKKQESNRLHEIFGAEWDEYNKSVPNYIPKLTPYHKRQGKWSLKTLAGNSEHWTFIAIIAGVIAIYFNKCLFDIFNGLFR